MNQIKYFLASVCFLFVFISLDVIAQTTDARTGLIPPITSDLVYYFEVVPTNPSGNNIIDAIFTLSESPIGSYTDCSTILRFNNIQSQPYLDVHDGNYTKTNNVSINFDQTYQCWFDIDYSNQTYSTYVLTEGMGAPTLIFANAQFRKKDINALNFWSAIHYTPNSSNPLKVVQTAIVGAVGEAPDNWKIINSDFGIVDNDNLVISDLESVTIAEFMAGVLISGTAQAEIIDESDNVISSTSTEVITNDMKLRITGTQVATYELRVRSISSENKILYAFGAEIDHSSSFIFNLYNDISYHRFVEGIIVSEHASFQVMNEKSEAITDLYSNIGFNYKVKVTAEDGTTKTYVITTSNEPQPSILISNSQETYYDLGNEKIDLEGEVEIHILAEEKPFAGTLLNIKSEDVWIYLGKIRPQQVNDNYLGNIVVNGLPAEVGVNMRLVQFGNGSVIIGHPSTYKPLTVYADQNLSGESMEIEINTYYKTIALGDLADNIESFVLKKGYMATLAENTNGTGYSKVFIANKEDIVVNTMPTGMSNSVSFIRVMPWRWVNKKGFVGSPGHGDWAANASWTYSHGGNGANSTLNTEFVPLRHNPNWPSYSEIQNKENVTHALFYNEPDNSVDDGFSSVADAIEQYPNLLASGLRMVSPAPTDGGVGWLVDFVNQCKAKNYRLDAVAIHFYRGGQSTQQFYDFLLDVHNRTGLPVWITEWNNGCNWTCCLPSYESQGETIEAWTTMLENAPFVERYVLWAGCNPERAYFYNDGSRTPGGVAYLNHPTSPAYSEDRTLGSNYHYPKNKAKEIDSKLKLSWTPEPGAVTQKLYFGDSFPPPLLTYIDGSVDKYEPEVLDFNKTYYWKVDSYVNGQFQEGEELEFATITYLKPSNPNPENGATNVETDLVISWNSDSTKEELHKLYLGTHIDSLNLEATFLDQVTSFNRGELIGKLKPSTTYFWKVDEHIILKDGTEYINPGEIWSFTTRTVLRTNDINEISVFPNPAKDKLFIKGNLKASEIKIYNVLGELMHSQISKDEINISSLRSGIYFLKINRNSIIKIIKE